MGSSDVPMTKTISIRVLLKNAIWTVGTYGLVQALRLVTNVALARLLVPELFGVMLIVNSVNQGINLISDVGIGQNVIYNRNAEDPEFYNTAWSLQLTRSIFLWLICLVAGPLAAHFYRSPILTLVVPITGLAIVISGFTSISRELLRRKLQIAKLSKYELTMALVSSLGYVLLAFLTPTIWALVFGGLLASVASTIGSYFLLPDLKQRFFISKKFSGEILAFGKWIFVSSIIYFLSTNFDRLYLAGVVPLKLLGIYGIARSISELLGQGLMQIGSRVLFPLIASHSNMPRADLRKQLSPIRAKFLLIAVFCFSLFVATADLAIKLLYDQRYQAASWMLPVLILGAWFTILVNLNESTLLGLGKPVYGAMSNGSKLGFLLIALPIAVESKGVLGGVITVALADLFRYIPIFVGQKREGFSYGAQDLIGTAAVLALVVIWEWLRWIAGFGTSFDSLPPEVLAFFGH
jgi:O-antigen/teichoic acid export membrane protein